MSIEIQFTPVLNVIDRLRSEARLCIGSEGAPHRVALNTLSARLHQAYAMYLAYCTENGITPIDDKDQVYGEPVGRISTKVLPFTVLRQEVMLYTNKPLAVGTPLYTTPPQRKPLTREEIADLRHKHGITSNGRGIKEFTQVVDFVRDVEAHNIKEQP